MRHKNILLPFACAILLAPAAAHAYFLPLIGAGGVIITAVIGLSFVFFAAIYLFVYKLRRWARRRNEKDSSESEDDAPTDQAS